MKMRYTPPETWYRQSHTPRLGRRAALLRDVAAAVAVTASAIAAACSFAASEPPPPGAALGEAAFTGVLP